MTASDGSVDRLDQAVRARADAARGRFERRAAFALAVLLALGWPALSRADGLPIMLTEGQLWLFVILPLALLLAALYGLWRLLRWVIRGPQAAPEPQPAPARPRFTVPEGPFSYSTAYAFVLACLREQLLTEGEVARHRALFARGAVVQESAHVQDVVDFATVVRDRIGTLWTPAPGATPTPGPLPPCVTAPQRPFTYATASAFLSACLREQVLTEGEAGRHRALFARGATVQEAAHVQGVIDLATAIRERTQAEMAPPWR